MDDGQLGGYATPPVANYDADDSPDAANDSYSSVEHNDSGESDFSSDSDSGGIDEEKLTADSGVDDDEQVDNIRAVLFDTALNAQGAEVIQLDACKSTCMEGWTIYYDHYFTYLTQSRPSACIRCWVYSCKCRGAHCVLPHRHECKRDESSVTSGHVYIVMVYSQNYTIPRVANTPLLWYFCSLVAVSYFEIYYENEGV